jgi:hypothetical protein
MPTDEYDDDDDRARGPRDSRDDEEDDIPPRRRRDEEDDYDDVLRRSPGEGEGLSLASMIVGIISIPLACCCGLLSLPASAVAIILGFIGRSKTGGDPKSTTGLITGFVALLIAVLLLILGLLAVFKFDPRQFQK